MEATGGGHRDFGNLHVQVVDTAISMSSLPGDALLSLLNALHVPSDAALELLRTHRPLSRPSLLPSSISKWIARLNASVSSRDPLACEMAAEVVRQDEEGYAAAQCGKTWMGACLGALNVS